MAVRSKARKGVGKERRWSDRLFRVPTSVQSTKNASSTSSPEPHDLALIHRVPYHPPICIPPMSSRVCDFHGCFLIRRRGGGSSTSSHVLDSRLRRRQLETRVMKLYYYCHKSPTSRFCLPKQGTRRLTRRWELPWSTRLIKKYAWISALQLHWIHWSLIIVAQVRLEGAYWEIKIMCNWYGNWSLLHLHTMICPTRSANNTVFFIPINRGW